MATEVNNLWTEDNEVLYSYDLVSLFTNTPLKESLNIVKDKLKTNKTLKKKNTTHSERYHRAAGVYMTTTYFTYGGPAYSNSKFKFKIFIYPRYIQ